jgi:pimeloyl-ACP methyl ester carboxylesterase
LAGLARDVSTLFIYDKVGVDEMKLSGRIFFIFFIFSTIAGQAAIHESKSIVIGKIRQWISIKGSNENDPVILFLHGGPGSSAMSYGDQFTGELQKHFVVVQWDQRETGKTKKLNSSPEPLTVALFENDAFEMINYLRERFLKKKIYLMGHSWGGFLGLMMAWKHPELISCYFAISPMIYQAESERQTLAIMKEKATAADNKEELAELDQIEIPFRNGLQLYFHRKWLNALMGQRSYPRSYVEPWANIWLPLFNEASAVNCLVSVRELHCPVYFLLGDKDFQTYFKLTEEYYKMVDAPDKKLFWFNGSPHVFLFSGQKKIQEIILKQLLTGSPN